jgi:hypothetical protein
VSGGLRNRLEAQSYLLTESQSEKMKWFALGDGRLALE